ncbi:MAG: hypothetical protein QOI83_1707 [Streptomycetaceae bacterium]|jgi:uncharacterized protein (DUF2267 family)|nr:hypothetical protein [Streptomycetaceae bacterium]
MEYDEFVRTVTERADVPPDLARELIYATMLTLAERITGGLARELADQLPADVAPPVVPPEEVAQKFGVDEFVQRVKRRAKVDDESLARIGVRAVFSTMRDAVSKEEFRDLLEQLPNEFQGELIPLA